MENPDITTLGSEFLTYLGGQNHIQCVKHKVPLIYLVYRKLTCACGRKEHYRFSSFGCQCCICKRCCDNTNSDRINYISPSIDDGKQSGRDRYENENENNNNEVFTYNDGEDMVDSDDNGLDEEYEDNNSAIHNTLENEFLRCENDILERDNFDDF